MTETLRLAFGLDLQSYVIIACIVLVSLGFFYFLSNMITYLVTRTNERKEQKNKIHQEHNKKAQKEAIQQPMTLEEMNEKLALLQPEGTLEKTLILLGEIMPDFLIYLQTRPRTFTEANDYYYTYLQILNLCINIKPLESKVDYKSFVKKYKRELQLINKRFREIAGCEWLREMDVVLLEIYRFVAQNQTKKIDLRTVQYLLNNNQDLIIDRVDDKNFYHLRAEDYNEFGVELRGEFFESNFFTEKKVFCKRKDNSEFYL